LEVVKLFESKQIKFSLLGGTFSPVS